MGDNDMQPILNMKRRIGLGLCWLPGIGLPLACIELFGNKDITDEDRSLLWTIVLSHIAAAALTWVFFIGLIIWILCLVYAILTFCGKNTPEMPFLCILGKKLGEWTKPACACCCKAEAPAEKPCECEAPAEEPCECEAAPEEPCECEAPAEDAPEAPEQL